MNIFTFSRLVIGNFWSISNPTNNRVVKISPSSYQTSVASPVGMVHFKFVALSVKYNEIMDDNTIHVK